jgi:hypothetical protein
MFLRTVYKILIYSRNMFIQYMLQMYEFKISYHTVYLPYTLLHFLLLVFYEQYT